MTKKSDRLLGMGQNISRRDFLNGIAATAAISALPSCALNASSAKSSEFTANIIGNYPPALTGMRGNHDGSFDAAHKLALQGFKSWGTTQNAEEDMYDLIIVGGGISGLSAAHFYNKEKPDARILILDNHDDFGGHAKRNEFTANGKTLLGHGGSQTMVNPNSYPESAKTLLKDYGVKLSKFETAYDQQFYEKHGLRGGLHFDKKRWGKDQTVAMDIGLLESYIPVAKPKENVEETVNALPISEKAKAQYLMLLTSEEDKTSHVKPEEKWIYLYYKSYKDFLSEDVGITEPEVFEVLENLTSDSGMSIESVNAFRALYNVGLPGYGVSGLAPYAEEDEPYIHHFPDGNASIARLIVRALIPSVASGSTMEDIVTARFDYSKLDRKENQTNLRLNSTVFNVKHSGKENVEITYINDGKSYSVKGKRTILACYNSMIPHICPELPDAQKEALSQQVKIPVLYTNVAIRNWEAWHKMGFGAIYSPTDYHIHSFLNFPVSLGEHEFAVTPSDPVIIQMQRFPGLYIKGIPSKQRHRAARAQLLTTPFEEIERNTRKQLNSMMGEGGFDAQKDILGITVNRWSHGYSYPYDPLVDVMYDSWNDPRMPHMIGRRQFNRISIANSDASAIAMFEQAVEQGYRAAQEQLSS